MIQVSRISGAAAPRAGSAAAADATADWGAPVDDHRRRWLLDRALRWRDAYDHDGRIGPFAGVRLSGADVFVLAAWILSPDDPASAERVLYAMHAGTLGERDPRHNLSLGGLHLEGADLSGAELEGALLNGIQFQHANLQGARLTGASLLLAHLDSADLRGATLDWADLTGAHLKGASLIAVHAEGALLTDASLEGATLAGAHLAAADLRDARLCGANLLHASLAGADLRGTVLDSTTIFEGVQLTDRVHGAATLGDVVWGGVRLRRTLWRALHHLGDERLASWRGGDETYVPVLRAYRQLATALRAEGLRDDATRFAHRARIWQRRLRLRRFELLRYAGSWLLAICAGYGYRPGRAVLWCTGIIGCFALIYYQVPHLLNMGMAPQSWPQAVATSLAASQGVAFYHLLTQPHARVNPLSIAEGALGLLDELGLIVALVLRKVSHR